MPSVLCFDHCLPMSYRGESPSQSSCRMFVVLGWWVVPTKYGSENSEGSWDTMLVCVDG